MKKMQEGMVTKPNWRLKEENDDDDDDDQKTKKTKKSDIYDQLSSGNCGTPNIKL